MAFSMEWDWVKRMWDHVEARCDRTEARVARRPIWPLPTAVSDTDAGDRFRRLRPIRLLIAKQIHLCHIW